MFGVPHGGLLSPLILVLYVSDLEECLEWSSAITYADDTRTGTSGKNIEETTWRMKQDAKNV